MRTALSFRRAFAAAPLPLVAAALIAGLSVPPQNAQAFEQLRLTLGTLSGDGWRAQDVRLEMDLGGAADVRIAQLALPPPLGAIKDVVLHCGQLLFRAGQAQCPDGRLSAAESPFGPGPMPASFRYRADDKTLSVQLHRAAFAKGELDLRLNLQNDRWRLQVHGEQLDAAAVLDGLPLVSMPDGVRLDARLDLDTDINGTGAEVQALKLTLRSAAAGFSSVDGNNAGEGLALQTELSARADGADWALQGTLAAARGTVCVDNCWELPQQPVTLKFSGRWHAQQLALSRFEFQDSGVLEATGSLTYAYGAPDPWRTFDASLASADARRLYGRYLQPLLIGTVLENLNVKGKVRAQLARGEDGLLSVRSHLDQVSLQDERQRFGLRQVDGELAWGEGAGVQANHLQWQGGNLYQIPIGAAALGFETGARSVRLTHAASVPVFDGSLEVAQFSLAQPAGEDLRWNLDAVLTPISMQDFSRAMGWPEMAGRLSGVVPNLHYSDRRLGVDGVLLIRAFDGDATIRNLQIENLLGVVPTLKADLQLRNIDLQQLTGTFSFGRIEGRLQGSVNGLVLQNWRPTAFDARFATPEGDDSRHRISQRAVDNLTSLGGGVGGALSRSFLRFFEDFSYDRLGLSCRLESGVCHMNGVEPAANGYYIVKGGGLPRIDVIGYQRRVDWSVLIKRLATITSGGGPVIR